MKFIVLSNLQTTAIVVVNKIVTLLLGLAGAAYVASQFGIVAAIIAVLLAVASEVAATYMEIDDVHMYQMQPRDEDDDDPTVH